MAIAAGAVIVLAVAWWLSGALILRAAAARLPVMRERTSMPAPVADDVAAADAEARRRATSADAVGELGMAYHAALQPDAALHAYTLAEALDSSNPWWPYYRGLILIERGDHVSAREALRKVTGGFPAHALAHFHLGEMAFKSGELDAAATAYAAACETRVGPSPPPLPAGRSARRGVPLAAHCAFGLARVAAERGDRETARRHLVELVAAHPTFGPAHTLLRQLTAGAAATDGGRAYVPPIDPWLDAVVARSRHTDLLLKHASLALRSGDPAWREWLARRAVEANPSGLDVLLEMSSVLQDANRHEEALTLLRRAEQEAPGAHQVLVEQGQSLFELGRVQEAERVLRQATRVRDATAEYNLATVLDATGRWDEARVHYERALAINPFHARSLNNLGIGLARGGDSSRAIALYTRAIEAAPENPDAYTNMAGALMSQKRYDEALSAATMAVQIDPRHADAHNNRGIILAMTGRMDEARRSFEAAVRLDPSHADARANLSRIAAPR